MPRTVRTPGELKAPAETDTQTSEAEQPAQAAPRAKKQPAQADAAPTTGLPNAIDIDAKAITAPVLTNQGWVCPDETGRKPADALKP